MRQMLLLFFILSTITVFAQFNKDAKYLANRSYMRYAKDIDCENSTGTTIEMRICLNLEFQEIDSTLNVQFNRLLKETTNKKQKRKYIKYQKSWIKHRKLQSQAAAKGYNGHMFGILYLETMIMVTQNRVEEIEYVKK